MVALSRQLSLVAVLAVVPVGLVTRTFQVRVPRRGTGEPPGGRTASTHLQETLGGMEVIRALGGEATVHPRFGRPSATKLAALQSRYRYWALYVPLTVILSTPWPWPWCSG